MYRKILKTPSSNGSELPKPCKSILKRTESPYSSKKENILKAHASGGVKSVKFKKSKSVQQARLRSKLNEWLETKGKTPSRYFNLMYFDEQLSAQKKRDRSLSGRLSQDLVGKQVHSLQKEEDQNARKKLFKEVNNDVSDQPRQSIPVASRRSEDNEKSFSKKNTPRRTSGGRRSSTSTQDAQTKLSPDKSNKSNSENRIEEVVFNEAVAVKVQEQFPEPEITDHRIQENVLSMLQECLTLFRAGCPPEHILSWLENMEQHIPQTKSFAMFYACKAEIFTSDPSQMLEVLCQGVENNAQPSHLLSDTMRQLLAPHFSCTVDVPPTNSPQSQSLDSTQNKLQSCLDEMGYPVTDADHICDCSDEALLLQTSTFHGAEKSQISTDHSGLSQFEKSMTNGVETKRRSVKYTPLKESSAVVEGTPRLGSTIKYTVSVATPLPGQSPESVPTSVVTPVRRSARLSSRHLTPQAQREIDTVLDLTLKEAETTMFYSNPAIEEK